MLKKYSENFAGIISLLGSTLLIILGDVKSIIAAIMFTCAELILTVFGHRTAGYSLAALFFIIGNILLIYSASLIENSGVQMSLWGMSFAWFIGTCRYFVELWSRKSNTPRGVKLANDMPAVTGSINIFFKFPGVIFAVSGGDYIVAIAIGCWILSLTFLQVDYRSVFILS